MKTLDSFFEETDFSYLEVDQPLESQYDILWKDIYKPSQDKKIVENNVDDNTKKLSFNGLSKRGKFLCQIYEYFDCKNIAEVGTAEGYQFFTFCDFISRKNKNNKVFTCDIRDVRSKKYSGQYPGIEKFILGESKELAEEIMNQEEQIDLYWIDGAHHGGSVLKDVIRLAKTQSSECIWIFDDYNERFGIYNEINFLGTFNESKTISLGPVASGKPNNMMIVRGRF